MILQIKKIKAFTNLFQFLDGIVQDCVIHFTKKDVSIQVMDNTHTTMVQLNLLPTTFEKYECKRNTKIGVHLKSWVKMLKMINTNATDIKMMIKNDTELSLQFTQNDLEFNWVLKAMDINEEAYTIPPFKGLTITFQSKRWFDIVSNMPEDMDSFMLSYRQNQLQITGNTVDQDIKIKMDVKENKKETYSSTFNIPLLKKISCGHTLSSEVILGLKEDTPLHVTYNLTDGLMGNLNCFIAPVCKDDDYEEDEDEDEE